MSSKINILAVIRDQPLKERLAIMLACDWSNSWNLVEASRSPQAASTASVAIIDDDSQARLFGQQSTLLFLGHPEHPERYFQVVEYEGETTAEALFKAIKKAFAYRETTRQNIESLYPGLESSSALETVAHSLSDRLQELQKLSDMRLAIIEQMPVGVIGIDDEGVIVLANPLAVELLAMEDIPLWGMEVDKLLKGKLSEFIKDNSREFTELDVYGQTLSIRKSSFVLEKSRAGTILVILRQFASPKTG